jgi:hypothetical protein
MSRWFLYAFSCGADPEPVSDAPEGYQMVWELI